LRSGADELLIAVDDAKLARIKLKRLDPAHDH
jgi:hypothetical protein